MRLYTAKIENGCIRLFCFILCFSLVNCAKTKSLSDRADGEAKENGSIDDSDTTLDGGSDSQTQEDSAKDAQICSNGYQPDQTGNCRDIDECYQELDQCDNQPEACVNHKGGFSCRCPSGYTGDGQGEQGCVPVLLSLEVSPGVLDPSFTPETTTYTVEVEMSEEMITVTPLARAEVTIEVDAVEVVSGSSSGPVELDFGPNQINVQVSSGGASRTYTLNVIRGFHYLKSSNSEANDGFAFVSLYGDTLAVGAPYEASDSKGINGNQDSNIAPNSGAVYIFTRVGATWSQQAYLKSSNTDPADGFGVAVSLFGDTLAVAAPFEASADTGINGDQDNNDMFGSGAVYIFTRVGTTWSQQAYIKASNANANDAFGASVSLYEDTLAVGAFGESSEATGVNGDQGNNDAEMSGAVYVFNRDGATWNQRAYLKASNTDAGDSFGCDVSLYGDTLAVGAYGESSNATGVNGEQDNNDSEQSGAVYVFTLDGTTWSQQAYLKASNTDAGDGFGSVAIFRDTLAIGAPSESSNATGVDGEQDNNDSEVSGAVYVFNREGTTWDQQAYLKARKADPQSGFGASISLYENSLAVGVPGQSGEVTNVDGNQGSINVQGSGAVYVFNRDGTTWNQRSYLTAGNSDENDNFGGRVSLYGNNIAVGAIGESSSAVGVDGNQSNNDAKMSGAVYIFRGTAVNSY